MKICNIKPQFNLYNKTQLTNNPIKKQSNISFTSEINESKLLNRFNKYQASYSELLQEAKEEEAKIKSYKINAFREYCILQIKVQHLIELYNETVQNNSPYTIDDDGKDVIVLADEDTIQITKFDSQQQPVFKAILADGELKFFKECYENYYNLYTCLDDNLVIAKGINSKDNSETIQKSYIFKDGLLQSYTENCTKCIPKDNSMPPITTSDICMNINQDGSLRLSKKCSLGTSCHGYKFAKNSKVFEFIGGKLTGIIINEVNSGGVNSIDAIYSVKNNNLNTVEERTKIDSKGNRKTDKLFLYNPSGIILNMESRMDGTAVARKIFTLDKDNKLIPQENTSFS